MNKKAEKDPIAIIVSALIGIILLGYLAILLPSLSCQTEKQQRDTCYSERDSWKNYANSLNETITNCSNLIQTQKDICDGRIGNATEKCETDKKGLSDFAGAMPPLFIIYTISFGVWIFLTFSLFESFFKIEVPLPEWLEEYINKHEKGVKITCWIIWSLTLVFNIFALFWQVIVPFYLT